MDLYDTEYWIDKKSDDSPVTKADHLSEEVILNKLPKENIGLLAEESGFKSKILKQNWIIDPLDGTKDFLQGTDEFAIMIGLLKEGSPVLGVIYSPATKEFLYAIEGQGAYLKNEKGQSAISVSQIDKLSEYRMVISRNHFREKDKNIAEQLGVSDFRPVGSVGIKYSTLARGDADICIYSTGALGLWDCCAPQIILEEAGGNVMDLRGKEPFYNLNSKKMENGFVGTNGKNKKEIVKILRKNN